jgi:hypothetical protein
MLKKQGVSGGLDSSDLDYGKMARSCDYGNEHFGSVKEGECSGRWAAVSVQGRL